MHDNESPKIIFQDELTGFEPTQQDDLLDEPATFRAGEAPEPVADEDPAVADAATELTATAQPQRLSLVRRDGRPWRADDEGSAT